MLEHFSAVLGEQVSARDAVFGAVDDLYIDATTWQIRYFVVDTRKWLPSPSVLIAPECVLQVRSKSGCLHVNLTKNQVEGAPLRESQQPVSRQYETMLFDYYGWIPYWTAPLTGVYPVAYPYSTIPESSSIRSEVPGTWTQLRTQRMAGGTQHEIRSLKEMTGYSIHAIDDRFGKVADFVIDTNALVITDILLDSRKWLPGGVDILCPSFFVTRVDYPHQEVEVALHRSVLENAPAYRDHDVDQSFHEKLLRYYVEAEPQSAYTSRRHAGADFA